MRSSRTVAVPNKTLETPIDIAGDIEACEYSIRSPSQKYCVIDADEPHKILYADGNLCSDRDFWRIQDFDSEAEAVSALRRYFKHLVPGKNVRIVLFSEAARHRKAHNEARLEEMGAL